MKYLFEDKEADVLSVLYRSAYPSSVSANFVYSEGSGNLFTAAEDIVKFKPNERVLVFLDVVPDNRETMKTYRKLRGLYKEYAGRVVTMPLVCSEHYFIRSISKSPLIKNVGALDICCDVSPWRASDILETDQDLTKAKNFEKFCKLFLIKAVEDCARHTRGKNKSNDAYGYYYTLDCLCNKRKPECTDDRLVDKALRFVHQFPCYPIGDLGGKSLTSLNHDKLLDLNDILCKWHNAKIQEFGMQNICETLEPLKKGFD